MKKKYIKTILTTVLISALLTACGDEHMEDELAYRQIGINNMEAGNYEDALIQFSTALEQHVGRITETEIDICYYKAAAQYALNDLSGAMETYNALIDYNEKNGKAYFLRGNLYLETGNTEAALEDYKAAVKYCDKEYELYIQIYEKLSAYNMKETGEEYLEQALSIKGSGADNLTNRGRIYYLLGDNEKARTELEGAVQKDSVLANLYLAQVYDAMGDSVNAETYYQAYLTSGAADSVVLNALAEIEMGKGNYEAALSYISQGLALEEVTNKRALLYNQIIACEYTGDFAGAWNLIQEYTQNYPEDEAARREYVFLKNRQGIKEPEQQAADSQAEDTQTEAP